MYLFPGQDEVPHDRYGEIEARVLRLKCSGEPCAGGPAPYAAVPSKGTNGRVLAIIYHIRLTSICAISGKIGQRIRPAEQVK